MSPRTRTLSDPDRKKLWGLSRAECAFPQCRQKLVETQTDMATGQDFTVVVGEEAHIYGFAPDGPRYSSSYPQERLETYENRILLCPTHHTLVDARGGGGYDARTLLRMKKDHEQGRKQDQELESALRAYLGGQMEADDRVQFRQARLDGPTVESMFVDVPFGCKFTSPSAALLQRIAEEHPGEAATDDDVVATGAAQAMLHPSWSGNALIIGGPGQGKSTLLQYICQFHRARYLGRPEYSGQVQGLRPLTSVSRVPIKIELRRYAEWAAADLGLGQPASRGWQPLELFLLQELGRGSGQHPFTADHLTALVARYPLLIALDGLDEVANLEHREMVADAISAMAARLAPNSQDIVIVVTSRPGHMKSRLMNAPEFPRFNLLKLGPLLRLQYLDRWISVSGLAPTQAKGLRDKYLSHEELPHIRDLASYPMQFAILLHLLRDRGLFPKQRTELYEEYLKAFLDREETEDKDPLLSTQRTVLEQVHAYLGWYLQSTAESRGDAGQLPREELRRQLQIYFADRPAGLDFADKLFSSMESRVLCLVERENGFQFEVQSLREYFAALYVHENADPRGRGNSRGDCFEAMVRRPYWLNVCRFFVGMFTSIEVRGIYSTLAGLMDGADPGLATHLRLVAAHLLDDRCYEGQPDRELLPIVQFILDGPGARLAEDGFLDDSGAPLKFSEDAGRQQAIEWLKLQLPSNVRDLGRSQALAACLSRNSAADEDLRSWWWSFYQPSLEWLAVATEIGLSARTHEEEDKLNVAACSASSSELQWATELLLLGGYPGHSAATLRLAREELNEGMFPGIGSPNSPLEALCAAAAYARGRYGPSLRRELETYLSLGSTPNGPWRQVVSDSLDLGAVPGPDDAASWRNRLRRIAEIWGAGWVLHQAVAAVPFSIDLSNEATIMSSTHMAGADAIEFEARLRLSGQIAQKWRENLPTEPRQREFWLFSLLSHGKAAVVEQLLVDVGNIAIGLTPRSYKSMQSSLIRTGSSRLDLRDLLRIKRIVIQARTLWLLREITTDGTQEQIDKRVRVAVGDLLAAGIANPVTLLKSVGNHRVTPVNAFRGSRAAVPSGVLDYVRVGAQSPAKAREIIARPEDWPAEIVGQALGRVSSVLAELESIQSVAQRSRWFTSEAR
jgi:hypothetical protein